ncbi:uncharacterized protein LOC128192183 [Crassostrea angulata]|uniref:uncharacterized protein LOC128192183 n=1 Tax=Magallana angulata TaxID=2784310 RepID=UPI0022B0AFAA|nr:uncharacterized protein LOC128192183 [Crassostrea angulata]
MLLTTLFAVGVLVCGVSGKSAVKDVRIPCDFGSYDLNDDEVISLEEFLSATAGLTKINPRTLFERLDTNGDRFIDVEEIQHIDPSIRRTGILSHCRRRWCIWCNEVTVINHG